MRRFRTQICVLGVMVILALLLSCAPARAQMFTAEVDLVPAGHILRLVDGETHKLVVLQGVMCPESSSAAGKKAKRFTSERTLGQEVEVEVVERKGSLSYANVRLPDGSDLGLLLLAKGLARATVGRAAKEADETGAVGEGRQDRQERYPYSRGLGADLAPFEADETTADGVERRATVDENGVLHLYAKGDMKKNAALEEDLRRRREAYQARLREEEERYYQRLLRQEEVARQREAHDLEMARRQLEIEEQALRNERQQLYNDYLERRNRWRHHHYHHYWPGTYGLNQIYFVNGRARFFRTVDPIGRYNRPSGTLPYPWGDANIYNAHNDGTGSNDDDEDALDDSGEHGSQAPRSS
ncbi:MAG TPA: hypothetical protein HPP83_12665 [Candidatus Hydrogenedentes bacterium]|nr:hypothetical protein [Candidatus Hydrogenedentota bacterium]